MTNRLNLFFLLFVSMMAVTTFTACGDDDDDNKKTDISANPAANTTDDIVTGEAVEVLCGSATVYGYINNDADKYSEYGIVYGTESDAARLAKSGKKVKANVFDVGTNNRRFSVSLEGLSAETTYYYYAYAGQKTANKVLSFTTLSFCPDTNHPHMIDLGLTSGTKWACCNVGAHAPEQYGGYYAWGEVNEKNKYTWDTYRYWYATNSESEYIGSDIAGTSYDAATANWGSPWRMPTLEQFKELINNTTSEYITQKGVNGRKFTGSNGGTIFLPTAGERWEDELHFAGASGRYWSSTFDEIYPNFAYHLLIGSGNDCTTGRDIRFYGESVRPVRKN